MVLRTFSGATASSFLAKGNDDRRNCRPLQQFRNGGIRAPLSYDLVLDALAYLQRYRNYRFAIVQAETAVEVHVRSLLLKLMLRYGKSESEAEDMIENDGKYWGVKSKIRRLDDWTAKYATDQSVASLHL